MDLFSQLPDYNPPAPKTDKPKAKKEEAKEATERKIKLPEKGEAIMLEDIVSSVTQKNGKPLIYAHAGESCKIIAYNYGPLLVVESPTTGRFSVKAKQVIINE